MPAISATTTPAARLSAPCFDTAEDVHLVAVDLDMEPGRARLLSEDERLRAAFVKAHGDGLSLSLQDFDIEFGAGEPCGLLRTAWSSVEPAEWTLLDISELAAEGVAALAARTPAARVVRMPRNELPERKG